MNWIVRYCLISVFLCGIYTGKSQDIFHQADSLLSSGEFEQSSLAYEWIIYSGVSPEQKARAILGKVQSYKNLELFDQAGKYLDQLNTFGLPDSLQAAIRYETLLVNYLSGNYEEVQSRFILSRPILQDSDFIDQSRLIQCLSLMGSAKWEQVPESAELFIKSIAPPSKADSLITHFHTIFNVTDLASFRNPKTARILSMIIPGSGQIYSGYVSDGLISFGLHIMALGGAAFSFTQGLYFTGWIGGFGLLQRLYFGGVTRSEELAKQKNRLNKEIFIQPASSYLIELANTY